MKPTRRLKTAARKVFEQVSGTFDHLRAPDAEQLTQYAEWSAIYADALRETQKHPTVQTPVVNRSTGNVTGHKEQRNPAFQTLKESQQHLTTLARRLMIDAASLEKRERLATKRARARATEIEREVEHRPHPHFTEPQIQAVAEAQMQKHPHWDGDFRQDAISELESIWDTLAYPTAELCVHQYFAFEEWKKEQRHE